MPTANARNMFSPADVLADVMGDVVGDYVTASLHHRITASLPRADLRLV